MKYSAGLVLIKDHKVLLVHPTNSTWINTYSIPKGKVEHTESIQDAAIRETYDEVGILIPKPLVMASEQQSITYRALMNTGKKYKTVYYFIVNVDKLNLPDVLPQSQLQLDEVDWAGFLDYTEASKRIMFKQFNILTQSLSIQENTHEKTISTTLNNTSKQETQNGNDTISQ